MQLCNLLHYFQINVFPGFHRAAIWDTRERCPWTVFKRSLIQYIYLPVKISRRLTAAVKPSQFFQFFEEIHDQRAAGQVDPQVTLQPEGGLGPADFNSGKAPLLRTAAPRPEQTFINHFVDCLGRDIAQAAQITKTADHLFIKNRSGQQG